MPDNADQRAAMAAPARLQMPSIFTWLVLVTFLALFIQGAMQANVSADRLARGAVNLADFLGSAVPPDFTRLESITKAMWETLNMAIVGVTFGVILSLPFALLSARNTTPHPVVRFLARTLVSIFRTVPDLVWALIFVVAVGLGPLAGIMAIIMDTIGFCARFFSERIEEIRSGPSDAIESAGGGRMSKIMGAILPESLASLTATSLFGVEKAIRSAVVLGLVGAGGIGVELSTAMRMFRYDQALAIIIVILVVVIAVEQTSSAIRKRVM